MSAYLFVFLSLSFCIFLLCRVKDPFIRYTLLFALIARCVLAAVQVYSAVDLPGAGKDAVVFEVVAWEYAQLWLTGERISIEMPIYYYSAMIAIFYYIFGRFEIIPVLINVYLSLITVFLVFNITVKLSASKKAGRVAALFFVLIPTHNFYAAILLRETITILLLTISLYFLILWIEKGMVWHMLISFLALAGSGVMHGHLFLLLWVNLALLLFYVPQKKRFRIDLKQVILIGFILVLSAFLVNSLISYQLVYSGRPLTILFDVDFIRTALEGKYDNISRTLYLTDLLPQSYFDLIWQTPVRILYFVMAPFPWLIENFADIFFFSDACIYALLLVLLFAGTKILFKGKRQLIAVTIVMVVSSYLVLFSWGTVSYGTAWRHRQKLAPYLVPVASVFIAASSISKRFRFIDIGITEIENEY